MRKQNGSIEAFFALLRAGLWEKAVQLLPYGEIDFSTLRQLAEEQSIVGLVAAGLEHVTDVKVPRPDVLQFVGQTLQMEERNKAMNLFIAVFVDKMKAAGIYTLLVKGQGVAQFYERPLWRACGDVDLLMDDSNYIKAKDFIIPLADKVDNEIVSIKHQAMEINGFNVELHGMMPFLISRRVDMVVDSVIHNSLKEDGGKIWEIGSAEVPIPKPDNHILLVFAHFLHHFFIEGVGVRQICDWCRMLWTHRKELDLKLLEERIVRMGLMTEWRVFASLAVDYLGMPAEAMPFYDAKFKSKGEKVLKRVMKSGDFGHNNDLSYRTRYKGLTYKLVAAWRRFWDFASLVPLFPLDAPKFFVTYLFSKAKQYGNR